MILDNISQINTNHPTNCM